MKTRTITYALVAACGILLAGCNPDDKLRIEEFNSSEGIGLKIGSLDIITYDPLTYQLAYNETDMVFRRNFRFAFEGFFSLVEEGRWEVHSNELLWTMYRFPETAKTWLIGDGYFYNTFADPYYVGEEYGGYYMATDVGYLRFIYYAGLPCLLLFMIFIWKSSAIGMQFFPDSKPMFTFLFVLQLLVWLKVSSDIFSVFAIFLALGMARKEPDAEEEIIAAEI